MLSLASCLGPGLLLLCLAPSSQVAHADTTLSVVGEGRVSELAHRREIQLSPHSIEVAETITIGNAGRLEAEAIYAFSLPAKAAIYDMSVENPDGTRSRYGVVEAKAATRLIADPTDQTKADLGLLRMVAVQGEGEDAERRYELRIFPVPGQKSSKILLQWRSPVSLVSGSYGVRIPSRGESRGLARSEILLRTSFQATELYGGDAALPDGTRNKRHQFFAPAQGDLVIQARARDTKALAHAEVALYPLSATTGIAAVRVVLPDAARGVMPQFSQALVIVDVSRSMGKAGRDAASKLVDALLAELGSAAKVEAVLFDRKQSRVLGSMRAGSSTTRSEIVRAIRSASENNGSDLQSALRFSRQLLEQELGDSASGRPGDTLIAIVSDGILPTTLQGDDAIASLGPKLMGRSRILSAILVPPNAPLPAVHNSALGELAYRGKGRVAALHHAEAARQGKALLSELAQPQPLDTLEVELDRGQWVGADLTTSAAPGSSVTALGYYEGATPKRVTVLAYQAGKRIQLVAQKLPRSEARGMAQMTLADTSPDSFPGSAEPAANRRAFVQAAAQFGVVTEASAGIAIDKNDGFANDRLALATRWGGQYYRRLPPPAERDWKAHSFEPFEVSTGSHYQGSDDQRTGQLDREIITRRVRTHALPIARRCYDQLLRRDPTANGGVKLRIEISRGEVHHVDLSQTSLSLQPIADCIINAIYGMPIPLVRQGSDPEQINLVNYPLHFRLRKAGDNDSTKGKGGKGKVVEDTLDPEGGIDTSDPLSGIPE